MRDARSEFAVALPLDVRIDAARVRIQTEIRSARRYFVLLGDVVAVGRERNARARIAGGIDVAVEPVPAFSDLAGRIAVRPARRDQLVVLSEARLDGRPAVPEDVVRHAQ